VTLNFFKKRKHTLAALTLFGVGFIFWASLFLILFFRSDALKPLLGMGRVDPCFLKPLDCMKKILTNPLGFKVFLGHSPSGLSVVGIILRDVRDGFDGFGKICKGECPMA